MSAYIPFGDSLAILKENTSYMKSEGRNTCNTLYETLSHEWIEATKTDNMLRVSVTENTSDTTRAIRIYLEGGVMMRDEVLYVTREPKIKD
jgi:hypothetical protein